jgi:hypothetical protein
VTTPARVAQETMSRGARPCLPRTRAAGGLRIRASSVAFVASARAEGPDSGRSGSGEAGRPADTIIDLDSALRAVRQTGHHLEVRDAPVAEEARPRLPPVVAPDAEQGHPVVHVGGGRQTLVRHGATKPLKPLERSRMDMGRRPQFPGDRTGLVPGRAAARAAVAPQVPVPAVPKDRLAAHAAEPMAARERRLTIRRGRPSEVGWQAVPPVHVQGPRPSSRRAAESSEGAGEAVGPDGMGTPVRFDGTGQRVGNGPRAHGMSPDRVRKRVGHA